MYLPVSIKSLGCRGSAVEPQGMLHQAHAPEMPDTAMQDSAEYDCNGRAQPLSNGAEDDSDAVTVPEANGHTGGYHISKWQSTSHSGFMRLHMMLSRWLSSVQGQ